VGSTGRDPASSGRGASAALLGLVAQAALALAMALVGVWLGGNAAYLAVAAYAGGGLFVWIATWVLFQQQRLERIEALETEELAKRGTEGAALFEGSADALHVVRHRLAQLERYGLPAASLVVAAYFAAAAVALATYAPEAWSLASRADRSWFAVPLPSQPSAVLAIGAALAFASFLVARYLGGMAKAPAWTLLRGGAGQLGGLVLLQLGLVVAAIFAHFDLGAPYRIVQLLAIATCGLVAIEIALTFVLDLYRPRQIGETPRPAFDSRLLGLAAAPDSIARTINEAINYQVGFEITRSWFWQLLERAFLPLVAISLAFAVLQTSLVVVEPDQRALVTRLGRIDGEPRGPGLHFELPWPCARVAYYDVASLRELVIGSHGRPDAQDHDHHGEAMPILWTNRHALKENLLIVAPPPDLTDSGGGATRVPAVSLIGTEIYVHYRIRDVRAYATTCRDPEGVFAQLAEAEVARALLAKDIDTWLGGEARAAAGVALRGRLDAIARERQLGIEVVWVGLAGLHPAQEVAESFQEVVGAQQERRIAIQRAEQQATQQLAEVAGSVEQSRKIVELIGRLEVDRATGTPRAQIEATERDLEALMQRAGGKAAQRISGARSYRWERENAERSKAARFAAERDAYARAPRLYAMRRYLDAVAEGLEQGRKYVIVASPDGLVLRFDLKDTGGGVDLMEAVTK